MRLLLGTVGWGVSIYALMYLLMSGLMTYGLAVGYVGLTLRLLTLALLCAIAVNSLRVPTTSDLVPFALAWALVAFLLDALLLIPLYGFALYASYDLWLGYLLIVVMPFLVSFLLNRFAGRSL